MGGPTEWSRYCFICLGDEHNLNQKPHPTTQFSHHEKVIPELYSGNKKLTSTYDAEQVNSITNKLMFILICHPITQLFK